MKKKTKQENIFLYWALVASWMFLIFFFSDQSGDPDSFYSWQYYLLRKVAHVGEYLILVSFSLRALRLSFRNDSRKKVLAVAFFGVLLFAISDEWHQTFIIGRDGNLADIGVDIFGIILGIGVYLWIERINKNFKF